MTLISYAQNAEDVLLWRALGHIKNGFYIDAGANDPVDHSVTKAFYDAGWHGINIEPLPGPHAALLAQRPRDINLALAAGAGDGRLTLFDIPAVNGWASPAPEVAEAHRAAGFAVAELTVLVRTLAGICAEHVQGAIHFLKIDVEGFEAEVLRGMDLKRWRPWIMLIEATRPGSRESNHQGWEPLVLAHGYRLAWFDGLNRYYVADEHAELQAALSVQPNVFDDFISHHLAHAMAATEEARAARARAEAQAALALAQAEEQVAQAGAQAAQAARERDEARQRAADAVAASRESSILSNVMFRKFDEVCVRVQLAQEAKLAAEAELAALRESTLGAQTEIKLLRDTALAAQADAAQAREAHVKAHQDGLRALMWAHELEHKLVGIEGSRMWRLNASLRLLGDGAPLRRAALRLSANQRLRRLLLPVLLRFPRLGRRVAASLAAIRMQTPPGALAPALVPDELRELPVSARAVLADLQRQRGA
ncbi:FkbM family methyltransferase [Massilia glaciei]|uniref:FkbM family methyltransferase n=1 Tax=Massilia glaciei TaxID=1524097 RepID=A0A2U2HNC2_9BURK|nr:FkbM family methyltransferase [Massilia glaciei]PWF49011.1 FkbM family methyltransferase [Massilia glaciei]